MGNDAVPSTFQTGMDGLRAALRGELLDPSHAAYDATRIVWNGMIDRRPAFIVRCRNAGDVAASVGFAREHRLT